MNTQAMNSLDARAFWLTEERLDKTRRRRTCLGCGEVQEHSTKEAAPSYVAWYKSHQGCRPDKNFEAKMDPEPGIGVEDYAPTDSLPECSDCRSVGVYITPTGKCMDCAGIPRDEQDGLEERQLHYDQEAVQEAERVYTREALLDRSPANPGHRSHTGPPICVSEPLMTKISQSYSGQSIADKGSVRKPFTYEGTLYVYVGHNIRVKGGLEAYKLVARDEWPGETLEYKHLNPQTGYHGIEVKHGKTIYVMQGPEVTFVCKEQE